MSTVAIIDYKLCNLHSVAAAVKKCGHTPVITDHADEMRSASHLILPGVGSFADAMKNIRNLKVDTILKELVSEKKYPLLGICLGMQLLATKGDEGSETDGLQFIDATVSRLQSTNAKERIPHIGWNEVSFKRESPLLKDIPSGNDFYFVHSYAVRCTNKDDVLAQTPYCGNFTSIIEHDNVYGTQFHPEKSQKLGLQLLHNFLTYC
jgi:glutamine amidotransferase